MTSKPNPRDELLETVIRRQRNYVFPDTVRNEGVFWRNAVSGEHSWTPVQRAGIFILGSFMLLPGCFLAVEALRDVLPKKMVLQPAVWIDLLVGRQSFGLSQLLLGALVAAVGLKLAVGALVRAPVPQPPISLARRTPKRIFRK